MGNLLRAVGNIAGGVVKGAQAQQELNQRQQQIDMQQARTDREKKEWAREDEDRSQAEQLKQKWLGAREEDVTDPATGQVIGKKQIPAWTPNDTGPEASARMLGLMKDQVAYAMGRTGDPSKLAPLVEYVQKHQSTEEGKTIMAAMSGDPKAFAAVVTKLGGDPAKAKPKGVMLDLGNGKPPVDIRSYLFSVGAYDAVNTMQQMHSQDRQDKLADATINLTNAKVGTEAQRGNLLRAKTANAGAGGGGGETKVSAAMLKQIQAVVDRETGGKTADPEAANYVLARAAAVYQKTGKLPTAEIAKAASEHRAASQQVAAFMKNVKKMSDAERKAKFRGISDLNEIRRQTLSGMLGTTPAVSVGDDTDTEE